MDTKLDNTAMRHQKNISAYCLSVICEMLKELVRASFSGALKNNENNSSFDTMTQGHPEMKLICLDFSKQTEGSACQYHSSCFFKLKFIYSEKVTQFCEIFNLLLSYVVPVKSKVKILQNFVAFSEYMNFMWLMPDLHKKS